VNYSVVAIEREYASGGLEIGEKLAGRLGIPCYGQEILKLAAQRLNISPEALAAREERITGSLLFGLAVFANAAAGSRADFLSFEQKLAFTEAGIINELVMNPCVIIGRSVSYLLKDRSKALKVFIHADYETRIKRAVDTYKVAPGQAKAALQRNDRRRANYFKVVTGGDWKDPDIYHIFLNSGKTGIDRAADFLCAAVGKG